VFTVRMISMKDCLAFCDLTEEEVLAIAEHEHMHEMIAIAYAQYLEHRQDGMETVFKMIAEDIRAAQARNDSDHVRELLHVLHHFIRSHPEAAPQVHPWSKAF